MKTYGQACALASALDRIGGRWTMLILRELLAGPARYADLQRGLPGIATNLLTERLKDLAEQGLIERTSGPYDTTLYQITSLGELTRPALAELGKLGFVLGPVGPPPTEIPNLRFMTLALHAILNMGLPTPTSFDIGLLVGDEWLRVEATNDSLRVTYDQPPPGTPVVAMSYESLTELLQPGTDLRRFRSAVDSSGDDAGALDHLIALAEAASSQPVG